MTSDGLLNVRQLAGRLGCSQAWVYEGCEIGIRRNGSFVHLPHYRIGKHLRFSFQEVLAFLKSDGEG